MDDSKPRGGPDNDAAAFVDVVAHGSPSAGDVVAAMDADSDISSDGQPGNGTLQVAGSNRGSGSGSGSGPGPRVATYANVQDAVGVLCVDAP